MKKNGFTLAEVLITLTIIGVIAMLTLPAIVSNTQEQQAVSGLKKGINTLTNVAQTAVATHGVDYISLNSDNFETDQDHTNIETIRSLLALLATRANVDLSRSGAVNDADAGTTLDDFGGDVVVTFKDGTALHYVAANTVADETNSVLLADNLPVGFTVIYDTNGRKGPNVLSNCIGTGLGALDEDTRFTNAEVGGSADTPDTSICTESTRVIRDQFALQLRGASVSPYGAASQWALDR